MDSLDAQEEYHHTYIYISVEKASSCRIVLLSHCSLRTIQCLRCLILYTTRATCRQQGKDIPSKLLVENIYSFKLYHWKIFQCFFADSRIINIFQIYPLSSTEILVYSSYSKKFCQVYKFYRYNKPQSLFRSIHQRNIKYQVVQI